MIFSKNKKKKRRRRKGKDLAKLKKCYYFPLVKCYSYKTVVPKCQDYIVNISEGFAPHSYCTSES